MLESKPAFLRRQVKELEGRRRELNSQLERLDRRVREKFTEAKLTCEEVERALRIEGLMARLKVSGEELTEFFGENAG